MTKTKKIVFTIIISLFIVGLMVVSIYSACKSSGRNANLYTIISAWISFFATFVIGFLTLWLTYKIDRITKKNDELRDKEQRQQYINQLKLNASPIIYFENIEHLNYLETGMIISNNESVNRLLDRESKNKRITAVGGFSFDLIFKTPKPENVENIHINAVDFYIKKTDGLSNEYKHSFNNYSSNCCANLKYTDSGCLACHTDLLYLQDDEEVIDALNNVVGKENIIVLKVELTASNALGLYKNYSCGFYFNISTKTNGKYGITNYNVNMKDNVMWAKEVVVKNSN